ncbi:MAG: hypothetical protein ACJ0K4_15210 [Verrucomicrobiales bacterium]
MNRENTLSIRVDEKNPFHHLWNNNGTWWLHLTMHGHDSTKKRIRRSLRTKDCSKAVLLRDKILADLGMGVSA